MINEDDERYQELPDHERQMYLHFFDIFKDGDHLKLPVPFELGAITMVLPPAIIETFKGNRKKSDLGWLGWNILVDTFRLDWPQVLKPIAQQWANKDMYTGIPIVGHYEDKGAPQYEVGPKTSLFAQQFGKAASKIPVDVAGLEWLKSPKRVDRLGRDILGGFYAAATDILDWTAKSVIDPDVEDPALRFGEKYYHHGVGRFYKEAGEIPRVTKTQQEFYEIFKEIDKINVTYNTLKKQKRRKEAREWKREHRGKMKLSRSARRFQEKIRRINTKIKLIHLKRGLTAEEKQRQIDNLLERRQNSFERAVKKFEKKL
jgi:hypothetical protein